MIENDKKKDLIFYLIYLISQTDRNMRASVVLIVW